MTAARKQAELALSQGVTPLEMMVATARWAWDIAAQMQAEKKPATEVLAMMQVASKEAVQAAPYVHARLSSTQVDGSFTMTVEDVRRIASIARAEAARRGLNFSSAAERSDRDLAN
jgi:hypothetical protein